MTRMMPDRRTPDAARAALRRPIPGAPSPRTPATRPGAVAGPAAVARPAHPSGAGAPAPAAAASSPPEPGAPRSAHQLDVADFLDRFARAFSQGDLMAVARCHTLPALVLTDVSSSVFETREAIAEGFRDVIAEHRRQNLVSTVYRLEALKALTPELSEITVRWTYRDDRRRPRFHQRCRYVLRRDPEQGFLVQTAIVLGDAER